MYRSQLKCIFPFCTRYLDGVQGIAMPCRLIPSEGDFLSSLSIVSFQTCCDTYTQATHLKREAICNTNCHLTFISNHGEECRSNWQESKSKRAKRSGFSNFTSSHVRFSFIVT